MALSHDRPIRGRPAAPERRGDGGIQIRRECQDGGLLRDDELGIAARAVEAERVVVLAEVRALAATLAAPAARLLEVDDHPVALVRRVHVAADLRDPADDLVARDERRGIARFLFVEQVQIRVADARGEDLHDDVLRAGLWIRELDQLHITFFFKTNGTHAPRKRGRHKTVWPRTQRVWCLGWLNLAGPKST